MTQRMASTEGKDVKPQDIVQKVKAGRGWLVVRNSGTLADTDYERVADEIVDALNKRHAYEKLVKALRACVGDPELIGLEACKRNAAALLREIGESS